jgi:Ribbon-helix-helix protein, copG family
MRTTVRIEDDLLARLKARALAENVSLTRIINRALKAGLDAGNPRRRPTVYCEQVHAMGTPRIALDKALALAAALEDEEVARELTTRR